MKNTKRSKWEKTISIFVVFAITVQMTMNYTSVIVANEEPNVSIQSLDVSSSDVLPISIEGVSGTTDGNIALGEIVPIKFEGYEFVNATVDNTVVNYTGIYEGQYYFANTDGNNSGAYLLGDSKVTLNYKKTILNFPITYTYDENVVKIVGDSSVNETKAAKFRIEMLLNGYEIISVKANETALEADADGYYYLENDGFNKNVVIESKMISQYKVTYNKDYINTNIVNCNGSDTVQSGGTWEGTIVLSYKNAKKYTLNSIMVNDKYINIPNGSKNDSFTTTLDDGTEVTVAHSNGTTIFNDHTYKVTAKNVKYNLTITPVLYDSAIDDITMTNIEGLSVYHWNGTSLDRLSKGDIIYKNDNTDYFFVKTEPGYEAKLEGISGAGSKIIERTSVLNDSKMKTLAEKLGCNYVFYYSDKSVSKRTANLTSQLIQYKVTYDTANIIDDKNYNILENNIINISSIEPTKSDYTFVGWKIQDNNKTYQAGDEIILNEKLANALKTNTIALTAQWVKNEDMKTTSYQIRYYFQQENKEFVENTDLRKTIKNAPIGPIAFLMDKDKAPIGEFEFDAKNKNNVLSTKTFLGNQTAPLKAYYVMATREVTYSKGNAKEGKVPVDTLNPYKKGTNAVVLGNEGKLVGDFENKADQEFVCWKASNDNYYFPSNEILMNTNVTLSPVFVGDLANDKILTLTSDKNGKLEGRNKFAIPNHHTFGEVIKDTNKLPIAKANVGFKFAGWYYENKKIAENNSELFNEIKEWSHSGTLEARFIPDEDQYVTVIFNAGDHGNYAGNKTKVFNNMLPKDKVNMPELTTDRDYVFTGYNTEVIDVIPTDTTTKKYEYTAQYKDDRNNDGIADEDQYVTVTFNAGDHGNYAGNKTKVFENMLPKDKVNMPELTTDRDYVFTGYDKEVIDAIPTDTTTKKYVYTAQYKDDRNNDGIADEDQYVTVTFNAGDYGNYAGDTTRVLSNMLPGETVNVPELDVNDGYTFTEYDKNVLTTIAKDSELAIEYTAQYVQNPIVPDTDTPDTDTPDANTPDANTPGTITPTTPGPTVNAPVAPAPVTPVPAPVEPEVVPNDNVVVEDNETPRTDGETIEDNKTPRAKAGQEWALLNLVLAIATAFLGAWIILSKKKEIDGQITSTTKRIVKISSGLLAIISVIAFVVTQNMTTTMVLYDKWSMLMIALAFVQVAFVIYVRGIKLSRNSSSKEAS